MKFSGGGARMNIQPLAQVPDILGIQVAWEKTHVGFHLECWVIRSAYAWSVYIYISEFDLVYMLWYTCAMFKKMDYIPTLGDAHEIMFIEIHIYYIYYIYISIYLYIYIYIYLYNIYIYIYILYIYIYISKIPSFLGLPMPWHARPETLGARRALRRIPGAGIWRRVSPRFWAIKIGWLLGYPLVN